MDYITSQLENRIKFLLEQDNYSLLSIHLKSRLEYIMTYCLGYLWNKNLKLLEQEDREYVSKVVCRPSIGNIISILRKLDCDKHFLTANRLGRPLDNYVELRNKISHGYIFEDNEVELCSTLKDLYDDIVEVNLPILNQEVELVAVSNSDTKMYRGILYKADGSGYQAWACPVETTSFEDGSLYGYTSDLGYFRLSPFVEIDGYGRLIGIFNSVEEKLLGKVKYNKLLESGHTYREWTELRDLDIENDGLKVRTANGTIRNVYENNYKKYIDIGIKKKLRHFLKESMSSVCATVWGHGGVGKTATVQSICEDLANDERKTFDYILFFSAKDRKYNYFTGLIEDIDDRIRSFDHLMATVNLILFDNPEEDQSSVIDFKGKLMLIIDDFETFIADEKEKIKDFVLKLNANYHKVVITTRANIIIGQEFQTNELSREDTKKFLLQILENEEIPHLEDMKLQMEKVMILDKIFEITSGRPLFLFQLAFIIGQVGVEKALSYNITENSNAISFLYGRIFDDYLSESAKGLFVVLSLLVNQEVLGNVLKKAQYVLNLEGDNDKFMSAVNELVKLKVIKLNDENTLFEVYSKEIVQIMNEYFQKSPSAFKGPCIKRSTQINRERSLGIDESLLLSANANRIMKNEIEVIDGYRQILNRATSSMKIKLNAILNLSAYLIDRGKRELALQYLDDESHALLSSRSLNESNKELSAMFTKMYATYYWANGTREQKHKAIEILLAFAALGFDYAQNIDLEIAGLLLGYRSILAVTDWQELKEKYKFGEISEPIFKQRRSKQIQLCKDIHDKQGIFLFNKICLIKLDQISSGARQNLITGLYSFLEVLIRIQKFETAKKICDYVLHCAPKHFHQQFIKRGEWIDYVIYKNQRDIDYKKMSRSTK